ncbi:hypothetical protein GXW82_43335 [Streptacidiphilus sp. 4-A2]|nr:hypothetical protein [Streptacidiphilus sp. 4-A2]
MTETGAGGFYIGIEGHITFDDGTQAVFSARRLDPHKLGELDVATIVPVRYSADHQHVVLDTPKLEALRTARKQEAAGWPSTRGSGTSPPRTPSWPRQANTPTTAESRGLKGRTACSRLQQGL